MTAAIRNLKASLRNTDYRFTSLSPVMHRAHAVEINASNEFHCHTCKVAGIF
jgi:hypothetical protein